ncbi:MAG: 50S ribosomal protein L24 [Luteibaculaceae bacterium]
MQKKLHIKTGDLVQVIAGASKGKEGKVLTVNRKSMRATVEGVNMIKKRQKPSATNPQGGILELEGTIHISNLLPVDPKTGKPTRVGFKVEDGKKVRFAKKSGEVL